MKKTTSNGVVIDTDKLADTEAELIELIEASPIVKFGLERNCSYFLWACVPKKTGYSSFFLKDDDEVMSFVGGVNGVVNALSKGKWGVRLVPESSNTGDEWKKPE